MMLSIGFLLITATSFLLFYLATGKNTTVLIISVTWVALIGTMALLGFFEDTESLPPRFMLILLGNVLLVSYSYRKLKSNPLNEKMLLLIHGLRLPVEIGLYQLFLLGLVPRIMTFEGRNYDIFIGILALVLFVILLVSNTRFSKPLNLTWQAGGLISLLLIVVTAVLSAPSPFQVFAFDQPNVAVLQFPFVFLPAYIVPTVLLSHLLALRKLT